MSGPLRVCIDARIQNGARGGVQQTLLGLARGLARLDGDEEYLFLAYADAARWLGPWLGGRCRLLPAGPAPQRIRPPWREALRQFDKRRRRLFLSLQGKELPRARLAPSDGTAEASGAEVMHFATQAGFRTDLPSIYVPHDLQHLHLPELFTPEDLAWREGVYEPLCAQSRVTVALARWGKDDLIRSYGLPSEKVRVIGWAPILPEYPVPGPADLAAVRARLALPPAFALYPAQTFAHKNHLRLLEALAVLRDRHGLEVPLVLAGHKSPLFARIRREARRLGVSAQVIAPGFVPPLELQCLYKLARLLVFPSRFEGYGMPVVEAFHAGVPVASSNVTCLPEIAGDAALLFDPESAPAMAEAMRRLWTDEGLRARLVERGAARVHCRTWDAVARSYRALYRWVAGRPLSAEDERLLAETV